LLAAAIRPAIADEVVTMEFEGFGPAGLHMLTTHTVIEENAGLLHDRRRPFF